MTQKEIILDYFKKNTTGLTEFKARRLGIGHLASRISELKQDGYKIETKTKKVRKANGRTAYVAAYFYAPAD